MTHVFHHKPPRKPIKDMKLFIEELNKKALELRRLTEEHLLDIKCAGWHPTSKDAMLRRDQVVAIDEDGKPFCGEHYWMASL